jgi:flagellar motor component MotA
MASSCTGVRFETQSTPAQDACRDYAQALIDGGSREEVTAGMEQALSTARSDPSSEAQAVGDAIEALLTQSVIGTNESVLQANDGVLRACASAGVTLEMTE